MNRIHSLIAVAALALASPAWAALLQVPQQFNSIADAIQASQDGDVVELDAGVYNEPVDYQGKNITIRGAGMDFTMLSGAQFNDSVVRFVNGEGSTAKLQDLAVQLGTAPRGGGVLLVGASPRIERCRIVRNSAATGGGAWIDGGSPYFSDCEFISNSTTSSHGGGVYAINAEATFSGCIFASNTSQVHAGAMYTQWTSLDIESCQFRQNEAVQQFGTGGGLLVFEGSAVIADTTFTGNQAKAFGALAVMSGSAQADALVTGCTMTGNTAEKIGGAVGAHCVSGSVKLVLKDSLLQHNEASRGGAISARDTLAVNAQICDVQVVDCQVLDNLAQCGGGIHVRRTSLLVHGGQLGINRAEKEGGGIYADGFSKLDLQESHLRGNSAGTGGGVWQDGGRLTMKSCNYERNTAVTQGGGCWTSKALVTDEGSTFQKCSARYGAGLFTMQGSYQGYDGNWTGNMAGLAGGAQLAYKANVMLAGTMIAENTAGSTGGGLAYGNCTSVLRGCTLSGNASNWAAGGAYVGSGQSEISDSEFTSNHAELGAGLVVVDTQPDISSCRFLGNIATVTGGGIYAQDQPWIANSTFCDNTPNDIEGLWVDQGGNTMSADCCPMDLDGNGSVDLADAIELMLALNLPWAPDPAWDFNGDGVVDILDAVEVMNNQGPC